MRHFGRVFVMMCMLFGAAACGAEELVEFPTSSLAIDSQRGGELRFKVELAQSNEQLAQGLMFREEMAEDAGMLFNFGRDREVFMWMKNTPLPLDMLFINSAGEITRIVEHTEPYSLRSIGSGGLVRAVLELNAGTVKKHHIQTGDVVVHPWFVPKDGGV